MPAILAIETSCDETAVAILRDFGDLLASEIWSQAAIHAEFGGVVPEIASRNHLGALPGLVTLALEKAGLDLGAIDAIAATAGPGLPAALLVGMAAAKGLAIGAGRPFLAINHVEGHLLSPFFGEAAIEPHVGLIVSGGHTLLVDVAGYGRCRVLGSTVDDAAGEAFDKVAKLMGLGYPGGIEIDQRARRGDAARCEFPRAMLHSGDFQFSFSGLKTAVRYFLEKKEEAPLDDVCASFQEAVVDVLAGKALRAVAESGRACLAVSGGVSANARLQHVLRERCAQAGVRLRLADARLRTDNAAMIAYVAAHQFRARGASALESDVAPTLDARAFCAA
jgi:N6-L-threonylcarbamoyladenine synthase